jgi:hypothetical protein
MHDKPDIINSSDILEEWMAPALTGTSKRSLSILSPVPTCNDCFLYKRTSDREGICTINGPVPADREAERCPSRTFRPKT